ncbi:MAG: glycosyltransferase [Muribaculaceae bacterium]|nr:glycosyltransferase [Muribaculaceae bacterium]
MFYDIAHMPLKDLRRIIAYSSYVGISRHNLDILIKTYHLDLDRTLFYTFWFDFTTAGLILGKNLNIITRTHGHDLYENIYFLSSYWRRETFKRLKGCYPVSTAGVEYLRSRYPEFKDIISLRKLGTVKPYERLNPYKKELSDPYDLTLLSIARLSPEKGVDRQLKLLIEYALHHPDLSIRYIHIGDGLLKKEIQEISSSAPDNLHIELRGAVSNGEVHELLATLHIDLLLLLSHSEGLPISLCEAISYGIPYLATDVGGISEIVPQELLPLLPDDMTYTQFSDTMERILSSGPELRPKLFKHWQENFCADTLRKEFAKEISGMFS